MWYNYFLIKTKRVRSSLLSLNSFGQILFIRIPIKRAYIVILFKQPRFAGIRISENQVCFGTCMKKKLKKDCRKKSYQIEAAQFRLNGLPKIIQGIKEVQ